MTLTSMKINSTSAGYRNSQYQRSLREHIAQPIHLPLGSTRHSRVRMTDAAMTTEVTIVPAGSAAGTKSSTVRERRRQAALRATRQAPAECIQNADLSVLPAVL
jgi:hypothetical protein